MLRSHSLVFSDFDTTWYKRWSKELKQNKDHLQDHKLRANKFWQNAVMAQALYERGLLETDKRGVGFGVGRERLPALFASHGVKVTATDQDFTTDKAKHWQQHELATGTNSLNQLSICDPKTFKTNVSYQAVDMTKIPKNLKGSYDFVWSNCALGHLGSINAGIAFILDSAKCLKPGGYAVHTTEINVLSNDETVDNNPETVIFRPRDIQRLAKQLLQAGYELSPLVLNFGTSPDDQKIAISPKFGNDYSKLQVGGHLITQIVLIIKKIPARPKIQDKLFTQKINYAYGKNLLQQKKFARSNTFLKKIRSYEATPLSADSIKPIKKSISVKLGKKPEYVYLEYKNTTKHPLFGMHERLASTLPLALATAQPTDRTSKFQADDWFSPTRASIFICTKTKKGEWVKADYVAPGATFAYRLKLSPTKVKKGSYTEQFVIVQEGNAHLSDSEISVTLSVS